MQTSCRIEDYDVISVFRRVLNRCLRNIRRPVLISHGEHFHALLLTVDLQLFDRRRTVYVTGHKQRLLSFELKLPGEFRSCGRLTGTLKTCHHNHCHGASGLKFNLSGLRSHQLHKLFVYDLDHHLTGIQSVHHVLTNRALLDVLDKALYNFEVDVRLQESHLDLLERCLYIIFRKASLAAQVPKHILKFLG